MTVMSITGLCYCQDRFSGILTLTVSVWCLHVSSNTALHADAADETVSVCKQKCRKYVRDFSHFTVGFWFIFSGHTPRLPNWGGYGASHRPHPSTLRRFTPPMPSALPGNKADLCMHYPILWSGAATAKHFLFVDQSLPDFCGTREKSLSIAFLSDFKYL